MTFDLGFYLEMGTDPESLAASAMAADRCAHAMAASCLVLVDLAARQDASGHVLEAAVLRRAARWLEAETVTHRRVVDELVVRSGCDDFLKEFLKERRAASVRSREAMGPLFVWTRRYFKLALSRAALDEAEALLATGEPVGLVACRAVLDFLAANEEPGNG